MVPEAFSLVPEASGAAGAGKAGAFFTGIVFDVAINLLTFCDVLAILAALTAPFIGVTTAAPIPVAVAASPTALSPVNPPCSAVSAAAFVAFQ